MTTNYGSICPTVTNTTCSSGSSCAAGSVCTSSSQCTTGNCCAYIANLGFNFTLFNTITFPGSIQTNDATGRMTALSQEAYNAFLKKGESGTPTEKFKDLLVEKNSKPKTLYHNRSFSDVTKLLPPPPPQPLPPPQPQPQPSE